jgi:hypothetical protein
VLFLYKRERQNFVNADSVIQDALASGQVTLPPPSPVAGLRRTLPILRDRTVRTLVASLFELQRELMGAFASLQSLLVSATPIPVGQFASRPASFGRSLEHLEDRDIGTTPCSPFSMVSSSLRRRGLRLARRPLP